MGELINRLIKTILIALLLITALYFKAPVSRAQNNLQFGDLVINEIMWSNSSLGEDDEWIELRNMTDSPIDFSQTPVNLTIYNKKVLKYTVPIDSNIIAANGYFLMAKYHQNDNKTNLGLEADYVPSKWGTLYNSDVNYQLLSNTVIIDEADDGSGEPFAGKNGQSMERNSDPGDGKLADNWHTAISSVNFKPGSLELGTPRAQNSEIQPKVYSSDVVISEMMPDPAGPDSASEWVELYNTGQDEVDLNGWMIKDMKGSTGTYTIYNQKIAAHQFIYLMTGGKITLNNDTDGAQLYWPDNNLTYQTNLYENSESGWSFALDGSGNWRWTTTPTPGEANIFTMPPAATPEDQYLNCSVLEARNLASNLQVHIQGIASVEPEILGTKLFYLEDAKAGIQISSSEPLPAQLKKGLVVDIYGKTSELNSEKRIKAEIVQVTGSSQNLKPQIIKTGQIDQFQGQLISIKGTVTQTAGETFFLNDGSGEAKITVKTSTNIKKPKITKNSSVEVSGIVSHIGTGTRLLPRYQSDILVLKLAGTTGSSSIKNTALDLLGVEKAQAAEISSVKIGSDHRAVAKETVPPVQKKIVWLIVSLICLSILAFLYLFRYPIFSTFKRRFKIQRE